MFSVGSGGAGSSGGRGETGTSGLGAWESLKGRDYSRPRTETGEERYNSYQAKKLNSVSPGLRVLKWHDIHDTLTVTLSKSHSLTITEHDKHRYPSVTSHSAIFPAKSASKMFFLFWRASGFTDPKKAAGMCRICSVAMIEIWYLKKQFKFKKICFNWQIAQRSV